ncbi:hypothetical protein PVAND_015850 [Polypedilum vanderplanki]|uniref:MIP18 family-like domain-containing protein n=1 Tax=Polypedilum vanderplanki TaxID=319348 RepID=A0A9J6BDF5_POLVA|nr:hypothetical protein PVAND_015850 [Polypedilum vanderplanki]
MLSFFKKIRTESESEGRVNTVRSVVVGIDDVVHPSLAEMGYSNEEDLKFAIFDLLRTIKDPEKPQTLEELNVVSEDMVTVYKVENGLVPVVRIEFNPTVPHCSLATLIGLTIRIKIQRHFPQILKLDIYIKKGTHATEDEINKQINDRERVSAACDNDNLRKLLEDCIKEDD